MQQIPVLFFHKSAQQHVILALRSARHLNEEVVLMTDSDHKYYQHYAQVVDTGDHGKKAVDQFRSVYEHMSTNSERLEFSCFERWFVILDYMCRQDLKEVVYLDSDVMSFCNYTEVIRNQYTGFDMCAGRCTDPDPDDFNWSASGHISYWTRPALQGFCEYILDSYTNNRPLLEKKWRWHQDHSIPGGICDMTLIYMYWEYSGLKCGNFLTVNREHGCFDVNMSTSANEHKAEFEMRPSLLLGRHIKAIRLHDGKAFGRHLELNLPVRFYALHFQGDAKKLMPYYRSWATTPMDIGFLAYWSIKMAYGRIRERLAAK